MQLLGSLRAFYMPSHAVTKVLQAQPGFQQHLPTVSVQSRLTTPFRRPSLQILQQMRVLESLLFGRNVLESGLPKGRLGQLGFKLCLCDGGSSSSTKVAAEAEGDPSRLSSVVSCP